MGRGKLKRSFRNGEKKQPMDITFFVLVMCLLTIGLIMLFSASYAYAFYMTGNSFYYIGRQLAFAALGVAAMLVISRIDYHILRKFVYPIYAISVLLLVVVLFMPAINRAKRWIVLPGVGQFQPSEVAKFAIIVIFSHYIALNYQKMRTLKKGLLPFALLLIPVVGLMVLEPHLSGTILILLLAGCLLIIGGANLAWFGVAAAAAGGALAFLVMFTDVIEYAMGRLTTWLDPFSDPQGLGWQTVQSLLSIGSGGFFGLGLGQSRQKYLYVPEPQNDFIFAIVCEELGYIGALLIIGLFAALVWRGIVISSRAKDRFGAMLCVGLVLQVGIQAVLNIMVVTNTIPNTGISLPFFSYGGTSLIMLLAQMGVVLSISRSAVLKQ